MLPPSSGALRRPFRRASSKAPAAMEGFEVVRRLGQGSFGSVMKVVRRADGCEYAMKRVPIAQMGDREIADALNECRVLASVRATPA